VKAESAMWKKLRPFLMAAKLDPVRVENPIHPGTPDVNLCTGLWLELKSLPAWPGRDTNRFRISHYTPQQRVWLYRRWKYAPGSTFLLLEVRADRQWLLFDGDVAAKIVGKATKAEHRKSARAVLHERELSELPKILAENTRGSDLKPVCTGSFVHDEFTPCPVHDVGAVAR
jgi:hypothetical protein